jgi:hypothetical protein
MRINKEERPVKRCAGYRKVYMEINRPWEVIPEADECKSRYHCVWVLYCCISAICLFSFIGTFTFYPPLCFDRYSLLAHT